MKFNRTFVVLMAVVCALMLAGDVFAANRIEVKVNSEPIVDNTTCGKAGGLSFEWDAGSVIRVGDRIKIDLDLFGTVNGVTHQVTLCRDIDLVFAPEDPDTIGTVSQPGWQAGDAAGLVDDQRVVYFIEDSTGAVINNQIVDSGAGLANGIYFHIWGNAGNRRLWVDVVGDGETAVGAGDMARIIVGTDPGDKFVIKFLDQDIDNFIWHDGDVDASNQDVWVISDDDDPNEPMNGPFANLTAADVVWNTYCVNVSAWDEGVTARGTYNANIDSDNDFFTFIPSNPQVAHNGTFVARTFERVNCAKAVVGTIPMGSAQQTDCLFDYETHYGYCPDHLGDHRVMFRNTNSYFPDNYTYTVTLSILVNGQAAAIDNGVYFTDSHIDVNGVAFTDTGIGFTTRNNMNDICTDPDDIANGAPNVPDEMYPAVIADGLGWAAGNCVDSNRTRVIRMTYPAGSLQIAADHNYLWIDIPTIAYQTEGVNAVTSGDRVTVRVEVTGNNVTQDPCGGRSFSFNEDISVGTFVSDCGQNFSVVFPYLTDVGDWWSGLAITNMGNIAGSADIYVYEADGDTAQLQNVAMAAHTIKAWTLGSGANQLYGQAGLTTNFVSGDAVLGDVRSYIVVCSDFNIDGFCLLGNQEYGYAQGYLPRTTLAPEECD